mgnify:CR=1 FL=1
MPIVWLHILDNPNVNFIDTLMKLKYELTVEDVYDLLEYLEYLKFKNHEEYLRQKEESKRK